MPKKAIVLLSGGIDSATCLYIAKQQGFTPYCIIFDYGQRHRKELLSAKRIARFAHCKYEILKIAFPWKGSSLLDTKKKIPQKGRGIPSTYVPARNIIFLSHAASFAEAIGANAVYIGANARDYSGYPDCRPQFYKDFKKAIHSGLKNKHIAIKTPLLHLHKGEIIKKGLSLGVPYRLTWSCYRGGKRACGKCDSCRFRIKGFREANIKDPAL